MTQNGGRRARWSPGISSELAPWSAGALGLETAMKRPERDSLWADDRSPVSSASTLFGKYAFEI